MPIWVPLQAQIASAVRKTVTGAWVEGGGQLHLESRLEQRLTGGSGDRPMLRFVVRRVATSILLLVATSALVFFVLRLLPGDPVITSLGATPGVSPQTIARLRHEAGLDRPIIDAVSELAGGGAARRPRQVVLQSVSGLVADQEPARGDGRARLPRGLAVGRLRRPGRALGGAAPRGVVDTGLDAFWTVTLSLPAFIAGIFLTYFLSVRAGLLPDARLRPVRRRPGRQSQALRAARPSRWRLPGPRCSTASSAPRCSSR